jgi:hypothetical protein
MHSAKNFGKLIEFGVNAGSATYSESLDHSGLTCRGYSLKFIQMGQSMHHRVCVQRDFDGL